MRHRSPTSVPLYWASVFIVSILVGAYYATAFSTANDPAEIRFLFSGVFFSLMLIVVLLCNWRPYLFDPITLLVIIILFSVVLKIPYLVLSPRAMAELLAGKDVAIFTRGTYVMIAGFAAFFISYASLSLLIRNCKRQFRLSWNTPHLLAVMTAITVATTISALLAFHEIGFASLASDLSAKRFLNLEGASGRLSSALYWYYKFAIFSKIVTYLAVVLLIFQRSALTPKQRMLVTSLLVVSLAVSIAVPVVFSARAQAVLAVLDIAIIIYFSGLRLNKVFVFTITAAVVVLLAYMGAARMGKNYTNVVESILSRRYLGDITKTAQIIDHFQDPQNLRHGETIVGWMFLPVPKSVWPERPRFVDTGKELGSLLYGFDLSGVPPGFVGELFMNFGMLGLLVGMSLMGLVIAFLWKQFLANNLHPVWLAAGSMVLVRFSIFLFNNDFGTFMIKNAIETLPTAALIALAVRTQPIQAGESATT